MNRRPALPLLALAIWFATERAIAIEFEPLGKALASLLGTTKVFRKVVPLGKERATVIYSKDARGKPARVAFVEKGLYPPNCTHTWAIGLDPASGKVTEVRVIEMSCTHAYPTKERSFLDQFTGKGPADAAKLHQSIDTIAKATGSSKLATDAVKRSITAWPKVKGQL